MFKIVARLRITGTENEDCEMKLLFISMANRRPAVIVLALCLLLAGNLAARAQDAYYEASPQEVLGPPGTIIRQERLFVGLFLSAKAYRVLYRSTGLKGEPIAVSGTIVVPTGAAPAGGRPIVAWAHPTSGIVPRCAPSLALFKFQQIQGLRDMVRHGYIVTATDYPGLGTPGPHPYLVGMSEGRAVLDSLRAARNLSDAEAGSQVAVWGHSQGGQAVLYAGLLAKRYAPELRLVGVAAAAPATDLGTLLRDDFATPGGKNLLAMTLWSWARVFGAPIDKVVLPAARPVVNRLAEDCIESPIDIKPRAEIGKELQQRFLRVKNLTSLQPWRSLLAQNTIGILPSNIPIFLAQGEADTTVDPTVTQHYAKRLCAAGSPVQLLMMPKVGHALAADRSAKAAVQWISERFTGGPPPNNCGS
jgi:acetyl esterase/lipase